MNRTSIGFLFGILLLTSLVAGAPGQDNPAAVVPTTAPPDAAPAAPSAPADSDARDAEVRSNGQKAAAPELRSQAIRLRNVQADVVAELLSKLYGAKETAANYRGRGDAAEATSKQYSSEDVVIEADMISNSLLVRAPAERLTEIVALVHRLDQPAGTTDVATARPNRRMIGRGSGSSARSASRSIEELRAQYEQLELEAAQAAAVFGDERQSTEQREKAKAELRERVAAAFTARQALQRAELEQLRERFTRIEQQIESRDRIQEEIIEHRVEELLDPNLRWETDGSAPPVARSAAPEDVRPRSAAAERVAPPNEVRPPASQTDREAVLETRVAAQEKFLIEEARNFETQEQLLRLDLDAALLRVQAAKALLTEAENVRRREPNSVSESAIAERRIAVQQAELEVRRAQTLLEAHRQKSGAELPKLEQPDEGAAVDDADAAALAWSLLGLKLQPIEPKATDKEPFRGGLFIQQLRPGGPAEKAGLRVGDVLVGLHHWEIISNQNLAFVLAALREVLSATGLKAYVVRGSEVLTANLSPTGGQPRGR